MRVLPDQFLGALLGAWLGISTQIWERPALEIVIFVAGFVFIALFLGGTSNEYHDIVRWAFLIFLVLTVLLWVAMLYLFNIFENANNTVFFFILLLGWLIIGYISPHLDKKLKDVTEQLSRS
jgi:hypothetical protein